MQKIPSITPKQANTSYLSDNFVVLDVREQDEHNFVQIDRTLHVPMSQIPLNIKNLPKDKKIGVLCHHGNRSLQVTAYLINQGFDATNIEGGIERWALEVDPSLKRYNRVFGRISQI